MDALVVSHEMDASSFFSPESFPRQFWEDLGALQDMVKAGAVSVTDQPLDRGARGRVDKALLLGALSRLLDMELAGVAGFLGWTGALLQAEHARRYDGLLARVGATARVHLDTIERERLGLQHVVKYSTALPVRSWMNEAQERLGELAGRLEAVIVFTREPPREPLPVSTQVALDVLLAINPAIKGDVASKHLPAIGVDVRETGTGALDGATLNQVREHVSPAGDDIARVVMELLAFLIEARLVEVDVPTASGKDKKAARQAVVDVVKNAFVAFVKHQWPAGQAALVDDVDPAAKFSAILPRLLKASLQPAEREIMTGAARDGLDKAQARVASVVATYKDVLGRIEGWAGDVKRFLVGEFGSIVTALEESFPHQHEEISRFASKLDFYFAETRSQEEKVKIRDEIQGILDELDRVVKDFEERSGKVLNSAHVDMGAVLGLLESFHEAYKGVLKDLDVRLGRYDAFKLMGFVEEVRQFLEKRATKVSFITNMIVVDVEASVKRVVDVMARVTDVNRSSKILSVERGGLDMDGPVARLEAVAGSLGAAVAGSGEESNEQAKKDLSLVEERLNQLDAVRKVLQEKKEKLTFLLLKDTDKAKFLEERRVGECIICYDPITTLDEEVIVCPHCGRIGHYLCLAFWLEKYSMCPVCHGKLVSPDGWVGPFNDEQ